MGCSVAESPFPLPPRKKKRVSHGCSSCSISFASTQCYALGQSKEAHENQEVLIDWQELMRMLSNPGPQTAPADIRDLFELGSKYVIDPFAASENSSQSVLINV